MNKLLCGDNLKIMEGMADASIDLIATDPPFNTGKDWEQFNDKWEDGLKGYLKFMKPRIEQMHRLLKDTGSLYLHCDPTASHYIKMCLDAIFGKKNFKNEIVWKRRKDTHNLASHHMGRIHDIIYYYVKSYEGKYHIQYTPYDPEYIKSHYKYEDTTGKYRLLPCTNEKGGNRPYSFRGITRAWRFSEQTMNDMLKSNLLVQLTSGGPYYYKKYLSEAKGVPLQDLWTDISPVRGADSTGYPTQKPVFLYERMIKASSNVGDIVLDPFCGSGTTLVAANKLDRKYIGIDRNPEAIRISQERLKQLNLFTEG